MGPFQTVVVTELFPPAVGGSAVLFDNVYSRFESEVLVVTDPVTSSGAHASRGPVRVVHRPIRGERWGVLDPAALGSSVRLAGEIRRIARSRRGVVDCARALPEGVAALLARATGGPPYFVWAHGEDVATALGSRELTLLMKAVYRGAAGVIANSRSTARMIADLGVPARRVHVVHPGVDALRFRPDVPGDEVRRRHAPGGELLLLTVGRLQRRKGHDLVVEALAMADGEIGPCRWVVVGDGEERSRIERLVEEHGLAGRVDFAGVVPEDELPAYYAACDVFLHPNRVDGRDVEGFGIVFLEAAATGKPAIGGASGGVPEAVLHESTGLLVGGTSPGELAEAIGRLARSPGLRDRLGRAGRRRVETRFAWEAASRRVEALRRPFRGRGRRLGVLQLVLSLSPGGTERLVIDLSRRLAREASVAVCCLDQPGEWASELDRAGIEVLFLGRRPGFRPELATSIASIAAARGTSVLHCHQFSPFVYGALSAIWRPGLSLVYTEHGRLSDTPASTRRRWANRLLGRFPGCFYAVSRALRDVLVDEGFPPRRLGVIENGIDPAPVSTAEDRSGARAALGIREDAFAIGTVARLDPVKDLSTLLAAFAAVLGSRPGAVLVVVGDGPERGGLEAQARALGISAAVRFTGTRNDVRRILPAFDVYANSSRTEGISVTILEAMAASLPVVATRVGGTPEIVLRETGVLVAPGDPGALGAALLALSADRPRARVLGESGRARVLNAFTLERMYARYLAAYERAAGAARD